MYWPASYLTRLPLTNQAREREEMIDPYRDSSADFVCRRRVSGVSEIPRRGAIPGRASAGNALSVDRLCMAWAHGNDDTGGFSERLTAAYRLLAATPEAQRERHR
ncbi:hypothetical protein MTO96_036946 [Rhipicephalus appendiculatus]